MGTARPRFLDRMPARVEADRTWLEDQFAVFRTFTDHGRDGGLHWGATEPDAEAPTAELLNAYYRLASSGNVTCFSRNEQAHPINF